MTYEGNLLDLKHDCVRQYLPGSAILGEIRRCADCGRLWIWWHGSFGDRWKPLRGRKLRRWQGAHNDGTSG